MVFRFRFPETECIRAPASTRTAVSRAALTLALALFALPGQAQFKVIGADGKVTYTDREPSASEGKVVPLGKKATVTQSAAAEPELPFELRQATTKYPVTLYVTSTACEPCNSGRQMLKQRGIPFNEKLVVTAEDSEALERLSGAREAPTLSHRLADRSAATLPRPGCAYLDAAGYPRESRLPSTYQYPAAAPVVDRRARRRRGPSRAPKRAPCPRHRPPAPAPGGIRF